MSWLRLDDGFTKHPKFKGWTVAQKWAWLEVMEYCARYETGGRIPVEDLSLMPRSTTNQLLRKAEISGLIDRADDGGMVVHDWPIYNGTTIAEKVAYALAKHPDLSANQVHKLIGGTREVVLAEVARQRSTGSEPGTAEPQAEPETEPGQGGSETGSESGSHAREPVPSPKEPNLRAVPIARPPAHPSPTEQPSSRTGEQDLYDFTAPYTHEEITDPEAQALANLAEPRSIG